MLVIDIWSLEIYLYNVFDIINVYTDDDYYCTDIGIWDLFWKSRDLLFDF